MAAFRGERLVQALNEQFITQAELARALEVPERTVTRWRYGRSQPRRANVRRLAEVLNRDPHWFYETEDVAA
jgi:transcriptional regulator with XRE-family HTH domain